MLTYNKQTIAVTASASRSVLLRNWWAIREAGAPPGEAICIRRHKNAMKEISQVYSEAGLCTPLRYVC